MTSSQQPKQITAKYDNILAVLGSEWNGFVCDSVGGFQEVKVVISNNKAIKHWLDDEYKPYWISYIEHFT